MCSFTNCFKKNKIVILIVSIFLLLNTGLLNNYKLNINKIEEIFSKNQNKYLIYIKKKSYSMFVVNRDIKIERRFDIAIGRKDNFSLKIYQGDNGTPEGVYYINEILNLNANTNSDAYIRLKKINSYYFKAADGYYLWDNPQKDAGRNVYGPRFFRINYPNEEDNKRYEELKRKGRIPKNKDGQIKEQGGGIAIHGTNDPYSIGHRISTGCIRMHNADIINMDKYVQIGTPVYIEK